MVPLRSHCSQMAPSASALRFAAARWSPLTGAGVAASNAASTASPVVGSSSPSRRTIPAQVTDAFRYAASRCSAAGPFGDGVVGAMPPVPHRPVQISQRLLPGEPDQHRLVPLVQLRVRLGGPGQHPRPGPRHLARGDQSPGVGVGAHRVAQRDQRPGPPVVEVGVARQPPGQRHQPVPLERPAALRFPRPPRRHCLQPGDGTTERCHPDLQLVIGDELGIDLADPVDHRTQGIQHDPVLPKPRPRCGERLPGGEVPSSIPNTCSTVKKILRLETALHAVECRKPAARPVGWTVGG